MCLCMPSLHDRCHPYMTDVTPTSQMSPPYLTDVIKLEPIDLVQLKMISFMALYIKLLKISLFCLDDLI